MTDSKSIFDFKSDAISITDVGKEREKNEDNLGYGKTPNGDVFVVCDGMGGHVGGQVASTIAVESIMEYFYTEKKPNVISAIREAIEFANGKIIEKWMAQTDLKGMGTTVVVLVIQNENIYIGHVGDSRAYLQTKNKLYRVTKDHSYVQGLVDNGIITEAEAEVHPRKSELTKALGIKQDVISEITKTPLQLVNGDMMLMCSDGLSGMVNDLNIQMILSKNEPISKIGYELLEMALNAGGTDNITLHLFRVTRSNFKKTIFQDAQEVIKPLDATLTDMNLNNKADKLSFTRFYRNKFLLIILFVFLMIAGLLSHFYYVKTKNLPKFLIVFNNPFYSSDSVNVDNTIKPKLDKENVDLLKEEKANELNSEHRDFKSGNEKMDAHSGEFLGQESHNPKKNFDRSTITSNKNNVDSPSVDSKQSNGAISNDISKGDINDSLNK